MPKLPESDRPTPDHDGGLHTITDRPWGRVFVHNEGWAGLRDPDGSVVILTHPAAVREAAQALMRAADTIDDLERAARMFEHVDARRPSTGEILGLLTPDEVLELFDLEAAAQHARAAGFALEPRPDSRFADLRRRAADLKNRLDNCRRHVDEHRPSTTEGIAGSPEPDR